MINKNVIFTEKINPPSNTMIIDTDGTQATLALTEKLICNYKQYHKNSIFFISNELDEIIDPKIKKKFNIKYVNLDQQGANIINPFDLVLFDHEPGYIDQCDFITTIIEELININAGLGHGYICLKPIHKSLIDHCLRNLYEKYLSLLRYNNKQYIAELVPTFEDLLSEIIANSFLLNNATCQERKMLELIINAIIQGINNIPSFSKHTNVKFEIGNIYAFHVKNSDYAEIYKLLQLNHISFVLSKLDYSTQTKKFIYTKHIIHEKSNLYEQYVATLMARIRMLNIDLTTIENINYSKAISRFNNFIFFELYKKENIDFISDYFKETIPLSDKEIKDPKLGYCFLDRFESKFSI